MNQTNIIKVSSNGISLIPISDELLDRRTIFLSEAVTADTMDALLQKLHYLEMADPGKEITLFINSPGGECLSGLAVLDYINTMTSPLRTVCTGCAASMGAILFLAGDKREMLRHTSLMIHDPSTCGSLNGMKPHEIENTLAKLKEMQSMLIDIISGVSGKSKEEISEITKNDTFFNLKEALEFGLATAEYHGQ